MFRTTRLQAPIISILSPSFSASKKAASLLSAVGNMDYFSAVPDDGGFAESSPRNTFKSAISGFPCSWASVGARCPVSGTIVHFCSPGNLDAPKKTGEEPFALLGITDSGQLKGDSVVDDFTEFLASRLSEETALNRTILNFKASIKGSLTAKDLLRSISHDGLPLLSIPRQPKNSGDSASPKSESNRAHDDVSSIFLKEIVVPHFDYAVYRDGSTLISELAHAPTKMPAVGVYEWPNSKTCIRPLPTAPEDERLPSPSLIFHCESPEDSTRIRTFGFLEAKIGYGGLGPSHGQVMLLHKDLLGLDVRYCPRTAVSSAFAEAQDSLLAGSLEELQSTNVLVSRREEVKSDARVGNGDCWIEVRANLKRPSKLFQRSKNSQRKQKIAKIPDLPYD